MGILNRYIRKLCSYFISNGKLLGLGGVFPQNFLMEIKAVKELRMRFVFVLSMVLVVSACLPIKQSVAPIVELGSTVKKDASLAPSISNDINVSGSKDIIKGENRVVVPYFEIVYFTEKSPTGFTKSGEENGVINAKLVGVTSDSLQSITNQIYDIFVEQMSQRGMEVLPLSSLSKSRTYQKASGGSDFPFWTETQVNNDTKVKNNTGVKRKTPFGPEAIYMMPAGLKALDSKTHQGKVISSIMNEINASLMDVTLYVTHMEKQVKSTLKVVTEINVDQMITVMPGSRMQFYGLKASKCEGYCPNSVVNVTLNQPIPSDEKVGELKIVARKIEKEEGIVATAMNWVALDSKVKESNLNRYELHADSVKYEQVVIDILSETTGKLVNELTAIAE